MEQMTFDDLFYEINEGLSEEDVKDIHPRMVSLFSGCGGLDLGFKQAGYNIVYANDFDKDAQRVYEANFGEMDENEMTVQLD